MPFKTRWPQSGVERVQQSQEDKRAMVERATPPATPAEDPWYNNLRDLRDRYAFTNPPSTWHSYGTVPIYSTATGSDTIMAIDWNATGDCTTSWTFDTANLYQNQWQTAATQWPTWNYTLRPQQIMDAWNSVDAWTPPAPLTQEEADRRLAATREAQHKSAIRRRKAIKKGRRLLLEVLTEAQQQEYARSKSFTITGADGKIYKLRKGGTTHQIDESGLPILSHCIHLPYSYIDEDTLIAVKMLLETDTKKFLEIANTNRLAAPRLGITIPNIPLEMADRAAALAGGINAINERFAALSEAAARARSEAERLGRAFETASEIMQSTIDVYQSRIQNAQDYGIYARELEHQVVAETVGPIVLPLAARHQHVARVLGHAEDIAGVAVAA